MTAARAILNFHGLGAPARQLESGEAPYWIDRGFYEAILDLIAARPDRDRIGLTFDDGNASDVEIGLPGLAQRGLRARFFVLAGRLGAPGSLDADGIAALERGGMAIGVHGFDHVDWRRLDAAGRRREMVDAREALAAHVRGPLDAAAIPFGAYDRSVLRDLRAAGYTAVFTSDGGPAGPGPVFARLSVRRDMTLDAVAAALDGREGVLRRARRLAATWRKRLL